MLARCKNIKVNPNKLTQTLSNNRNFAAQQKQSLEEIEKFYSNETGSIDGMLIKISIQNVKETKE